MSTRDRSAVERRQPPKGLWDHVVNPVMTTLLRSRVSRMVDGRLGLLRFRGRRSGRDYQVPVGIHRVDSRLCVLTNAGWRVNFRGGHPLQVRFDGRWRAGTGTLIEDVDEVARFYAARIAELGWQTAGRQLGIRINVDRAPTLEELHEAVDRSRLSVLDLTLDPPGAQPSGGA